MNKKTIRDVEISGKTVLIRVDFNVPQDQRGVVLDDKRIREALPTILYASQMGAKVVLLSHLGRPKGTVNKEYTLKFVARKLSELLDKKVKFITDCIGKDVTTAIEALKAGEICLLENVRFYKEETDNDAEFAKKLAAHCDIFVSDAFATCHRAHASTEGITKFVKVSVCGFLMEKELKIMGEAITKPKQPLCVILGGSKVSDKIGVIDNLLEKATFILVGGAMAFTFVKAAGGNVAQSKVDEDSLEYCRNVLTLAKKKGVKIVYAVDALAAQSMDSEQLTTVSSAKIPDGYAGFDIGPKTVKLFEKVISKCGTIVWNGPMGVFEKPQFALGTKQIATALAKSSAITIAGGGDTALALSMFNVEADFTHVSTGGGASLELLEGKELPGVACLENL